MSEVLNKVEGGGSPQLNADDQRLEELGYKPAFKRELSLVGVLGISFCAIGILTGMSSVRPSLLRFPAARSHLLLVSNCRLSRLDCSL